MSQGTDDLFQQHGTPHPLMMAPFASDHMPGSAESKEALKNGKTTMKTAISLFGSGQDHLAGKDKPLAIPTCLSNPICQGKDAKSMHSHAGLVTHFRGEEVRVYLYDADRCNVYEEDLRIHNIDAGPAYASSAVLATSQLHTVHGKYTFDELTTRMANTFVRRSVLQLLDSRRKGQHCTHDGVIKAINLEFHYAVDPPLHLLHEIVKASRNTRPYTARLYTTGLHTQGMHAKPPADMQARSVPTSGPVKATGIRLFNDVDPKRHEEHVKKTLLQVTCFADDVTFLTDANDVFQRWLSSDVLLFNQLCASHLDLPFLHRQFGSGTIVKEGAPYQHAVQTGLGTMTELLGLLCGKIGSVCLYRKPPPATQLTQLTSFKSNRWPIDVVESWDKIQDPMIPATALVLLSRLWEEWARFPSPFPIKAPRCTFDSGDLASAQSKISLFPTLTDICDDKDSEKRHAAEDKLTADRIGTFTSAMLRIMQSWQDKSRLYCTLCVLYWAHWWSAHAAVRQIKRFKATTGHPTSHTSASNIGVQEPQEPHEVLAPAVIVAKILAGRLEYHQSTEKSSDLPQMSHDQAKAAQEYHSFKIHQRGTCVAFLIADFAHLIGQFHTDDFVIKHLKEPPPNAPDKPSAISLLRSRPARE